MFNDIEFRTMYCKFRKSQELRGDEKKWYGTHIYTPEGKWNSAATPTKSISALSRGILNRKNNRDTTHFDADTSKTELWFRTVHSANQLSICGAVLSWCEEFGLKPNERDDFRKIYDERK